MIASRETDVPGRPGFWCALALALGGTGLAGVLLVPDVIRAQSCGPACCRTRANIASILQSLSEHAIDHDGKYPDTLRALVTPDAEGLCSLEGYDGRIPRDPWQREHLYERARPEHPVPRVGSLGRDGEPGGEGDDADIDSDPLKDEVS